MILHDAHNHLQHPRLAPHRERVLEELRGVPLGSAVVNGTAPNDWDAVRELGKEHPWVMASYGVHPWYVDQLEPGWEEQLRSLLESDEHAAVGEIGLDRWIENHDLAKQTGIFRRQLEMAVSFDRAATIHCVRAWGALWDVIREHAVPTRGFLLHAYSGPEEMVAGFAGRGAYFSFSPYFLHERKAALREVFQRLPLDRLLVETDAPDMAPPADRNAHPLQDADGLAVNHPANIVLAYHALSELRGIPVEELAGIVDENFRRLFGSRGS